MSGPASNATGKVARSRRRAKNLIRRRQNKKIDRTLIRTDDGQPNSSQLLVTVAALEIELYARAAAVVC